MFIGKVYRLLPAVRQFHVSHAALNQVEVAQVTKTRTGKEEPSQLIKESVPIEKQSLTRGMALNKFEKDFMIYPEHEDTDDYERIKGYVEKLSTDYKNALPSISASSPDAISKHALQVFEQNRVFATFVPKEFGGYGFSHKDLTMVTERLGRDDLSLFVTFNQVQSAAVLISVFGTDAQKAKYLPAIAEFRCKPAICIHDENTADGKPAEVWHVRGNPALLSGTKVNVINADSADLFIVFTRENVGGQKQLHCYVIERDNLGKLGRIEVSDRVQTQGIRAINISRVHFHDIVVEESQVLGVRNENSADMLEELRLNGKTFYGSAIAGFLKKLTGNLADFANARIDSAGSNLRVADLHSVQSAMTNLASGIYVLESMAYYISGLCDEDLFIQNDVENSIMQRYANRLLREAMTTTMDVLGLYATNSALPFDCIIRDAMTLISMSETDFSLVRNITLPTLESFIREHGSLSTFMSKFTLTKLIAGEFSPETNFKQPRLTHFIAEHVHPSLEMSARSLEQSMARVRLCIDRLLTDRGLYIKDDYVALRQLSTVLENNLGMTATIARASRSYSIGLRSAEMEMQWCNYFCEMAAKENENILQEVMNIFGIMTLTPKITMIGKSVLENNGYFLENPVERNW